MLRLHNYWMVALLFLLPLFVSGCAAERGMNDWPRGVVIPWSDVPKPVVDEFRRHFPDERNPTVESCGEGQLYRIDTGSIIYINKDGEWLGTII